MLCVCLRRARKDKVDGEIFDMLLSLTDFLAFKQVFLDFKKVRVTVTLSTILSIFLFLLRLKRALQLISAICL